LAGPRYHYRGDLEERLLPEMLSTIDQYGVPGVLQAIRDDVVKRLYLRSGAIVHATSSAPFDSLGSFLTREGRITQDQYRMARRARGSTETRFGMILVENGVLSEAALAEAVRDQVEAIVWSLFAWDSGNVTFSIGDVGVDQITTELPIRLAIKAGALYHPRPHELLTALAPDSPVEKLWEPIDLIDLAPSDEELAVLGKIDGRRTLGEICSGGPLSQDDAVRLLYGLAVLQLVHIRTPQVVEPIATPTPSERPEKKGALKIRIKTQGDQY
jgi:hypothetical protein